MTGAGNDFILIDNREGKYNTVSWVKFAPAICDRHFGIGADGLLIIESDKVVDFSLKYYNSDGSSGGMCGNGGRCAALFYMDLIKINRCNFDALGHIYSASISEDVNVSIKMKPVSIYNIGDTLNLFENLIPINFFDTGAPHVVIFMDKLPPGFAKLVDDKGIHELGKFIRNHTKFQPDGTNVDFIQVLEDKSVYMRTYERGVEGETLACGTGSVASACAVHLVKNISPPIKILTRSKKTLIVNFKVEGKVIKDIELTGPAEKVFTGHLEINDINY